MITNGAKAGYCKYGAGPCQFRAELGNLKMCRRCLDSALNQSDPSYSVYDISDIRFTS